MNWELWQWALAVGGALAIGVAKTGIGGLGMLAVVIFANLMPAKQSAGFVLPMLVMADVVAVLSYRRHAQWSLLWKLFPWTALGVFLGFLAMGRIDNQQAGLLIGVIVLGLVVLHLVRKSRQKSDEPEHAAWFAPTIGVLAGFTTLVANAAGPLMAIYLLAMRLPKMEYMGTGAWYFLLMNLFKVPFMMNLGLVDAASFKGNLLLLPAVLAGTIIGRIVLKKIDQKLFETLALVLALAAGINLLYKSWGG
ncbi:MAG: sulfite exporter TauE/SafE family protein [Opitutaceae bacterium]|nr:sulfite exporter TauE/SafE family protein [Cephaloticoccus sp.]MCP5530289.1 sulfite exporter TauE/SafE family protein [Opitutaceae bacterium]